SDSPCLQRSIGGAEMLGKQSSLVPLGQPAGLARSQIIGLALAVASLFIILPVGAKATGSRVTLVDPSSSVHVRVGATPVSCPSWGPQPPNLGVSDQLEG